MVSMIMWMNFATIMFALLQITSGEEKDPTYTSIWVEADPKYVNKTVWNAGTGDPEADAAPMVNRTFLSAADCASECLRLYHKAGDNLDECTGYNFQGDSLLEPGRCVLIRSWDATDEDALKDYIKPNPGWTYFDLKCPNGKKVKTPYCDDE